MTTPKPDLMVRHTSDGGWHRFDLFATYYDDQSSLRGTWSATTGAEVDALLAAFEGSGFRVVKVQVSTGQRHVEYEPA